MNGALRFRDGLCHADGFSGSTLGATSMQGDHVENVVSEVTVRVGYRDRPIVQNESFSARELVWHRLNKEQRLHALESLARNVVQTRGKRRKVVSVTSDVAEERHNLLVSKYPTRITLTESQSTAWMRDLADTSIPLTRLARAVPQRLKGGRLLEELITYRVDLVRAVWLVKVSGSADIRAGSKDTFKDFLLSWTKTCFDALMLAMGSACDSGSFRYLLRLVSVLQDQKLLELAHFARLFREAQSSSRLKELVQQRLMLVIAILRRGSQSAYFRMLDKDEAGSSPNVLSPDCKAFLENHEKRIQYKILTLIRQKVKPDQFWQHFQIRHTAIVVPFLLTWATTHLRAAFGTICRPYQTARLLVQGLRTMPSLSTIIIDWLIKLGESQERAELDIPLIGIVISELSRHGFSLRTYCYRIVAKGTRHTAFVAHCDLLLQVDSNSHPEVEEFLQYHRQSAQKNDLSNVAEQLRTCISSSLLGQENILSDQSKLNARTLSWKERKTLWKQTVGFAEASRISGSVINGLLAISAALYQTREAGIYLIGLLTSTSDLGLLDLVCQQLFDQEDILVSIDLAPVVATQLLLRLGHHESIGNIRPRLVKTYTTFAAHLDNLGRRNGQLRLEEVRKRSRMQSRRLSVGNFCNEIQSLDISASIEDCQSAARMTWLRHSADEHWLIAAVGNIFSWMVHNESLTDNTRHLKVTEIAVVYLKALNQFDYNGISYSFAMALNQRLDSSSYFRKSGIDLTLGLADELIVEEIMKGILCSRSKHLDLWLPILKSWLSGKLKCSHEIICCVCELQKSSSSDKENDLTCKLDLLRIVLGSDKWLTLELLACHADSLSPASLAWIGQFVRQMAQTPKMIVYQDHQSLICLFRFLAQEQPLPQDLIKAFRPYRDSMDMIVTGWSAKQSDVLLSQLGPFLIECIFGKEVNLADPARIHRIIAAKTLEVLFKQSQGASCSSRYNLAGVLSDALLEFMENSEHDQNGVLCKDEKVEISPDVEVNTAAAEDDKDVILTLSLSLMALFGSTDQCAVISDAILERLCLHKWLSPRGRHCKRAIDYFISQHRPSLSVGSNCSCRIIKHEAKETSNGEAPENINLEENEPERRPWTLMQTCETRCKLSPDLNTIWGPACLVQLDATLLDQKSRDEAENTDTFRQSASKSDDTDYWRPVLKHLSHEASRASPCETLPICVH